MCVSGGAGDIGQPISMLMAMNPLMKEVSIQNATMTMVPQSGVHADLSHLEYPTTGSDAPLIYHSLRDQLEEILTECHLVLIHAGMPRKPGITVMTSLGSTLASSGRSSKPVGNSLQKAMVRVTV